MELWNAKRWSNIRELYETNYCHFSVEIFITFILNIFLRTLTLISDFFWPNSTNSVTKTKPLFRRFIVKFDTLASEPLKTFPHTIFQENCSFVSDIWDLLTWFKHGRSYMKHSQLLMLNARSKSSIERIQSSELTLKTSKNLELILLNLRRRTTSKNQWIELLLDTPENYLNYAELNMRIYLIMGI